MSVNYSTGLSDYADKGLCGLPESVDATNVIAEKVDRLADMMRASSLTVVHTGAGISTSCGIPDFRGPKGVWTLEKEGKLPEASITFDNAIPSFTHRALVALEDAGLVHFLITQNVDGLHLRFGYPRNRLAILHGDMFLEECDVCSSLYIRDTPVATMAMKRTGNVCRWRRSRGICRGKLTDTILDWEGNLPQSDILLAEDHSRRADLSLCLGTSLQIVPSGSLPTYTKRRRQPGPGQLAIINLQATKHDKKADLKIHAYVDAVMEQLCNKLGVTVPEFSGHPTTVLKSRHTKPKERMPWRVFHLNEDTEVKVKRDSSTRLVNKTSGVSINNGHFCKEEEVMKSELESKVKRDENTEEGATNTVAIKDNINSTNIHEPNLSLCSDCPGDSTIPNNSSNKEKASTVAEVISTVRSEKEVLLSNTEFDSNKLHSCDSIDAFETATLPTTCVASDNLENLNSTSHYATNDGSSNNSIFVTNENLKNSKCSADHTFNLIDDPSELYKYKYPLLKSRDAQSSITPPALVNSHSNIRLHAGCHSNFSSSDYLLQSDLSNASPKVSKSSPISDPKSHSEMDFIDDSTLTSKLSSDDLMSLTDFSSNSSLEPTKKMLKLEEISHS